MPTLTMFFGIIIPMYHGPKEHNPDQGGNASFTIADGKEMKVLAVCVFPVQAAATRFSLVELGGKRYRRLYDHPLKSNKNATIV